MKIEKKEGQKLAELADSVFYLIYDELTKESVSMPIGIQIIEIDKIELNTNIDTLISLLNQIKRMKEVKL